MIYDHSRLIGQCQEELHRRGLTWKSPRTLDYCERVTGHRDAHYLEEAHLKALLTKLQAEPTPQPQEEEVA